MSMNVQEKITSKAIALIATQKSSRAKSSSKKHMSMEVKNSYKISLIIVPIIIIITSTMNISSTVISMFPIVMDIILQFMTYNLSTKGNNIKQAQIELQIREMTFSAIEQLNSMSPEKLNTENTELQAQYSAALERLCAIYEEACSKYLQGMVNEKWFENTFRREICRWIENDAVKEKYAFPHSRYQYTIKVYITWNYS